MAVPVDQRIVRRREGVVHHHLHVALGEQPELGQKRNCRGKCGPRAATAGCLRGFGDQQRIARLEPVPQAAVIGEIGLRPCPAIAGRVLLPVRLANRSDLRAALRDAAVMVERYRIDPARALLHQPLGQQQALEIGDGISFRRLSPTPPGPRLACPALRAPPIAGKSRNRGCSPPPNSRRAAAPSRQHWAR